MIPSGALYLKRGIKQGSHYIIWKSQFFQIMEKQKNFFLLRVKENKKTKVTYVS